MELSKKAQKRQRKRERDLSAAATRHSSVRAPTEDVVGEHAAQPSFKKKKTDDDGPWNFEVEYNDHFETPKIAYADLLPVLSQVAKDNNKTLSELVVYDPYYCAGQMLSFLRDLGVLQVINKNRDFYADVEANEVPEYDILVTNPPYSGEHKQKLLQYLAKTSNKPFCLLLPVYVASKSYWRDFVASEKIKRQTKSTLDNALAPTNPPTTMTLNKPKKSPTPLAADINLHELYLLPSTSYEYNHPEGTGKALPPFYSAWFIGGGFQSLLTVRREILSPEHNSERCLAVSTSVENLMKRGVISSDSAKRPNPRQRKKNKSNSSKN